jgi:hypothetical protein
MQALASSIASLWQAHQQHERSVRLAADLVLAQQIPSASRLHRSKLALERRLHREAVELAATLHRQSLVLVGGRGTRLRKGTGGGLNMYVSPVFFGVFPFRRLILSSVSLFHSGQQHTPATAIASSADPVDRTECCTAAASTGDDHQTSRCLSRESGQSLGKSVGAVFWLFGGQLNLFPSLSWALSASSREIYGHSSLEKPILCWC